jgi:hypothetical protein
MADSVKDAVRNFWRDWSIRHDMHSAGLTGRLFPTWDRLSGALIDTLAERGVDASLILAGRDAALPGAYGLGRSAWDLVAVKDGIPLGAIKFTAQNSQSVGNNFNNRVQELMSIAFDVRRQYDSRELYEFQPYLGLFFILEAGNRVDTPVRKPPDVYARLGDAITYKGRLGETFKQFCSDGLYDGIAYVLSDGGENPSFEEPRPEMSVDHFVADFAGQVLALAELRGNASITPAEFSEMLSRRDDGHEVVTGRTSIPVAELAQSPKEARDEDGSATRFYGTSGVQIGSGNVHHGNPARADIGGMPLTPASGEAGSRYRGHAFISYVREDSGEVDVLQHMLEAAGIPVWRDTASLWPGEDWRAKIRGAITRDALVFIACFSSHSAARRTSYQNEELLLAIDQLRRRRPDDPWLIPVRLDDCDIPDFELGAGRTLASIQRADLFGANRDAAGRRLVEAIHRLLGHPALSDAESSRPAEGAGSVADTLARIELERRKAELTPLFRLRCEPWTAGNDVDLRLRVQFTGPTSLGRIDGITITIRDDHFRRGEGTLTAGGPTREQIKEQIWGPYRFRPGTGPDEARADATGRITVYDAELPVGEELPYLLERTRPPFWATSMTHESWKEQRGPVIRLLLEPWRDDYGEWRLPCEIDLSADHDPHFAGWVADVRP